MNRWLVAFALGACTPQAVDPPVSVPVAPPSATVAPPPPPKVAGVSVPPAFAAIFEEGRTWSVRIESRHQHWDDRIGKTVSSTSTSEASCAVESVTRHDWGVVSQIGCTGIEPDGVSDPIHGYWIATSSGIHHRTEPPGEDPRSERPRFPRPLAPHHHRQEDGDGFGSEITIAEEAGAWCHRELSWGGDEGWASVCIEPARGFVSATWGWSGGSTHEHELELVETRP